MLDVLISQTVNGLVLGFLLVLVSVGLSLVFGLLGIVNVAHGAFFALGAFADPWQPCHGHGSHPGREFTVE